ncbi:CLUMA_CG018679, isoform A [Clunio marinus]|uniref:CLUMA_CG018679, isoform A n=1 Tax=Clunio marinus TaxID=568069 RepID=A0A1J1J0D4_9DIPT|nr:CLUMA_CG018679, isoform A [Clunio marinus]
MQMGQLHMGKLQTMPKRTSFLYERLHMIALTVSSRYASQHVYHEDDIRLKIAESMKPITDMCALSK